MKYFSLTSLLRLACSVLALQLIGCASTTLQRNDKLVSDSNQPLGPAQVSFAIEGRLLLKQGRRNDHLRFTWEHSDARDDLLLTAALGQGVARISRDVGGAHLETADGKKFAGGDWQALSQKVFGQALPLDELPPWLLGAHAQWMGERDGWKIVVTQAQRVALRCVDATACRQHQLVPMTSALVPRLIEISKDDTSLSIIVESWGDDE